MHLFTSRRTLRAQIRHLQQALRAQKQLNRVVIRRNASLAGELAAAGREIRALRNDQTEARSTTT